ncbi:hypothetical protein [Parapedobacter koreensis]|uniref:Uncharacterized protein n=1 Tax=Parapedobacter koreensis TaxID=332977 RepID=A0A1H7P1S8_9SPHI|nr:hypothetical protein [Parapedobacter koreensis]SEL29742.1 hypothetical protein SAMN05421740_104182 [Parapedobacter koreensis]
MQTILVELKNQKAYRLLKELEDLQLIRLVKVPTKLSALRKQVKTPMAETEIDKQLTELRSEWQRDI